MHFDVAERCVADLILSFCLPVPPSGKRSSFFRERKKEGCSAHRAVLETGHEGALQQQQKPRALSRPVYFDSLLRMYVLKTRPRKCIGEPQPPTPPGLANNLAQQNLMFMFLFSENLLLRRSGKPRGRERTTTL